ncbi:MAG: S49 family peptidase, partial [Bradyrhizobium sp.]|nr:S49 family peptidase [Bradyrhizobium sp.]
MIGGVETFFAHPGHVERVARAAAEGRRGFAAAVADRPLYQTRAGAALIPVAGPLLSKGGYDGSYGVTSYDYLAAALAHAAAAASVSHIVLAVDSPGGMVAGVDGAAEAIRQARQIKPVTAMVDGAAFSAAYWLASQADEIVMTPLSEAGSIGVVQAHIDVSKRLDDFGVKVTLLHAGAKKIDGHPFAPLPARVRDDFSARLEDLRGRFAAAVAEGRGLDRRAVLDTEADTFPAD